MKSQIDAFFSTFHSQLDVKSYIKDKVEIAFLYESQDGEFQPIKSWFQEEGQAAIDFLYDNDFDRITGFLLETSSIIQEIQAHPANIKLWEPFYNLAATLFNNNQLHPFFYPLLAEVVNAFKRNACDEQGIPLDDDHFVLYGQSYLEIKNNISTMIQYCFDRDESLYSAIDCYQMHNLHQARTISSFVVEIVPTRPYHDKNKTAYIPWFVLHPKRPEYLWYFWMKGYLDANVLYKRCENCMRYFIASGRSNVKYCDRIFEDSGKTCRQLMPKIVLQNKTENNVAEKLFSRAYKTMYSRVSFGTMQKEMFKAWSKEARTKRNACVNGEITPEEFSTWLCDSGLFIDYLKENQ